MDLKMEVYSPSLELLGLLEIQNSVIWDSKAFSSGSFSLTSLITSESKALLTPENIIWIAGDDAGIIEYVQQTADDAGPYISIKGSALTGILSRRILWGQYDLTGTVPEIMYRLVDDCCIHPTRGDAAARVIPNLVLADMPAGGEAIRMQKTGGTLLEALEELGTAYHAAFGIRLNPQVPQLEFWARHGMNHSIHQTDNEPVFYSTELDDILSSEYTYNSGGYRNVALVAGEGAGNARTMVTVIGDAVFASNVRTYIISASVDPAGSGTVSGTGTYQEGTPVTLAASPADGYKFTAWQEDGQSVSESAEYAFTADSNRTIVAVFAAVPVSRLPEGYTEVEYVESSGTQYISLATKPTATTKIVMDVEPTAAASSTSKYFFNSHYFPTSGTKYAFRMYWGSSGIFANMGVLASKTVSSDVSMRRMTLQLDARTKTASVDGAEETFSSNSVSSSMTIIQLLTFNSNASYALPAKLYSCQVYTGNPPKPTYDFVPCISPAGVVGLYDLVGKGFYKNNGSGTFTAGPAI